MHKLAKAIIFSLLSVFVFTFSTGFFTKIAHQTAGLVGAFSIASVATIIAFFAIVGWGVLVHLLLNRLDKTQIGWYLLCRALPCIFVVFIFRPFGDDTVDTLLMQSILLGIVGVLAAGVFWFFVRDKDTS